MRGLGCGAEVLEFSQGFGFKGFGVLGVASLALPRGICGAS